MSEQQNSNVVCLDEYQKHALRTSPRDRRAYNVPEIVKDALRDYCGDSDGADQIAIEPMLRNYDQIIWSLGLAGEAGEFADMMKKVHGHGHTLDKEKAAKELGDVLWYLSVLADSIGFKLSEIAEKNVQKLKARYPNGFTIEDSMKKNT